MALFECTSCGEPTEVPVGDGVVDLGCPNPDCDSETLTDVDELCRAGRVVYPNGYPADACYNEATKAWPDEEKSNLEKGRYPLCDEHYEDYTTFELPDGAIGRCSMEGCNHAVRERNENDELVCEACR